VDVPEDNHTRFKALCAMQRRKMAEEVNAFIAQRIAEAEQQGFRFFAGKQQRLDL
jgi:hypothetical protein